MLFANVWAILCVPWSVSCGAAREEKKNCDCCSFFYYKFGFLRSSNGGELQSDGAGVVVGVGGSGHPVPALVLRMATRWEEKCGRAGGNHQSEWFVCLYCSVAFSWSLKGHYVILENCIIHNDTDSEICFIFVTFSDENNVSRTLLEARKVAGSATCKQSKTVWNCFVLLDQFVYSAVKTKRVSSFILLKHEQIISLLIKMSFQCIFKSKMQQKNLCKTVQGSMTCLFFLFLQCCKCSSALIF